MNETLRLSIAEKFKNTPLGFLRIKKNLNISHFSDIETEACLKQIILSTPLDKIETKGKNHYFKCHKKNAVLTVNSHTLTVITAKKIDRISFQSSKQIANIEKITEENIFSHIDFFKYPIEKGDYENCKFINCNFTESDICEIKFLECEFEHCNLSMAKLTNTVFRDVHFNNCKMLGLQFEKCNDFLLSVSFCKCALNYSSFYQLKLGKVPFIECKLVEVDFSECNLKNSIFENCDLERAIFENTNIEKADFRSSYNYVINPDINKIKKAKFSLAGLIGLLSKYDIETY
jgi:uncharacterized protein YjbI with pentapeptide repeats